jgi:RimJ/RimL family protein N-acetyltransferase
MLQLVSPFPQNQLRECFGWHAYSLAFLNARNSSLEVFQAYMEDLLRRSLSWGIYWKDHLVGIALFEPLQFPGQTQVGDGYVHVAIARRIWGKGVIDTICKELIPEVFQYYPHLRRMSAWTLEGNTPARHLAERLGFTQEGLMRQGYQMDGKTHNLVLYGLVRGEGPYGWTNNHNQD